MTTREKSPFEVTLEELDRELIARGAQIPDEESFGFEDGEGTPERDAVMARAEEMHQHAPPPKGELEHISTWDLAKVLKIRTTTRSINLTRSGYADLKDWYEIRKANIKKNAGSIAAVCLKSNLVETDNGFFVLETKNYGKTFNLCDIEPFRNQPIAAGKICAGFLVKEDIIATAGSFVNENNVTDLRFVFGFNMLDSVSSETTFARTNIYRGVKIVHGICDQNEGNFTLVRLDREVACWPTATLSKKELSCDQPIYVIGHPLGLPLKYAPASVQAVDGTYFNADLNVYSSSVGSPVFDDETHEVIGIVGQSGHRNFRWTGKGWMSAIYPNSAEKGSGDTQCIRISKVMYKLTQL